MRRTGPSIRCRLLFFLSNTLLQNIVSSFVMAGITTRQDLIRAIQDTLRKGYGVHDMQPEAIEYFVEQRQLMGTILAMPSRRKDILMHACQELVQIAQRARGSSCIDRNPRGHSIGLPRECRGFQFTPGWETPESMNHFLPDHIVPRICSLPKRDSKGGHGLEIPFPTTNQTVEAGCTRDSTRDRQEKMLREQFERG